METKQAQQEKVEDLGKPAKFTCNLNSFPPATKSIPRGSDNGHHWLLGGILDRNIRWGSALDAFSHFLDFYCLYL